MFSDPTLRVESLVRVMEKVTSDEGRRRKVWERVMTLLYPLSFLMGVLRLLFMLRRFTAVTRVKRRRHMPVVICTSTAVLSHPGNTSPQCYIEKMR